MYKYVATVLLSFLIFSVEAQNLLGERIRQISNSKKSVYLDSGVFHNGGPKEASKLKAVRHSYKSSRAYERLVFDFTTNNVPRIYGFIKGKQKKIYLDFFKTEIGSSIGSFGKSKYVQAMNIFPIDKDSVSLEIEFKRAISVDMFTLVSPGRFVLDIKP